MANQFSKNLYEMLGNRIFEGRKLRKSISQDSLSSSVGLTRSSIAKIERGKQRFPVDILYGIAKELGVEVFSLLPTPEEIENYAGNKNHTLQVTSTEKLDSVEKQWLENTLKKSNLKQND